MFEKKDKLVLNKQGTKEYIYRYYNDLEAKAEALVENSMQAIKIEEIYDRILERQGDICYSDTIGNRVYDCFRKYVLEKIRLGQAFPKASCILLTEFSKKMNAGPNEDDELALQRIFSYFERKEFDYFINRYYFFDTKVEYNRRLERKIARLMNGRGAAWPIRWKKTKILMPGVANYVGYLDSMPEWFLKQVGKGKMMIPHPEAGTLSYQQRNYEKFRGYLVLIPLLILGLMIYLYFYIAFYPR